VKWLLFELSLESSHGDLRFLPSPGVPDASIVAPAPPREPRQGVTLEGLATFERSKRHPRALRADVLREQARVEASRKVRLEVEAAGQLALGLESLA